MNDQEMKKLIQESIKEAMTDCITPCPLTNLPVNFSHWAQSIETIGSGNFDAGVERMRKNHEFTKGLRETRTKIGGYIMNAFIVSIAGAVIAAIVLLLRGEKLPL